MLVGCRLFIVRRGTARTSSHVNIRAVVDANEPPLPGNVSVRQALNFAEALARGEKDRTKIMETIVVDKIHEVI